jgi:hypothetical protein
MTNQSPYRTADPLGPVVSEHPVAGVQQGIRIALGVFCLIVAIDCVWLGMWPRFGEIHWGAFIVIGMIALVFFWLSWDAFAQYIKARRQRVVCHEHGLRVHQHERHHDIRFDDVTYVGGVLWEVAQKAPGGAVMWLDDVQGQRFELPSPLANPHDLGEFIRGRTFEKRSEAAKKLIAHGEDVQFGRVRLSALVMIVDGMVFNRSEVRGVRLSNRWFSFAVDKKVRLLPTEQIPNLDVLLSMFRPE